MFGPSKRQLWRELQRERDFRRDLEREWLDRIAHLTGRAWIPAPADMNVAEKPEPAAVVWTATPEQDAL